MLRWTVAVLIAANLVFFAWTRGWLDPVVGVGPQGEREPQRLQQQVHPDLVLVLPLDASQAEAPEGSVAPAAGVAEPGASASPAAASAATSHVSAANDANACLEAGPFAGAEMHMVQSALATAGIAAEHWQAVQAPPVWLVYMGRFVDAATLQRKQEELQRIHVGFQEVHAAPALEPGLSLGRFGDKAAADDALARLTRRGVHTAHVVALPAPAPLHLLRLIGLERTQAARLQAQPWPLDGPGLRPCPATTAAAADGESAAASAG